MALKAEKSLFMGGWMDWWINKWVGVKPDLRIAYSNQNWQTKDGYLVRNRLAQKYTLIYSH